MMPDSFQERMGAGVVERARLESVCTSKGYRGFESLPIRHILLPPSLLGFTANAGSRRKCETRPGGLGPRSVKGS